jgi:hypothetical protein
LIDNLLAVFDLNTHECIAYIPLPPEGDDVQFDPALRRIYVACDSGKISMIQGLTRIISSGLKIFRFNREFAPSP